MHWEAPHPSSYVINVSEPIYSSEERQWRRGWCRWVRGTVGGGVEGTSQRGWSDTLRCLWILRLHRWMTNSEMSWDRVWCSNKRHKLNRNIWSFTFTFSVQKYQLTLFRHFSWERVQGLRSIQQNSLVALSSLTDFSVRFSKYQICRIFLPKFLMWNKNRYKEL